MQSSKLFFLAISDDLGLGGAAVMGALVERGRLGSLRDTSWLADLLADPLAAAYWRQMFDQARFEVDPGTTQWFFLAGTPANSRFTLIET